MNAHPLTRVAELGQSIWYDDIERGQLLSGGLKRLIDEYAVTGVTSNPTIFLKAMSSGLDYTHAIRDLVAMGMEAAQILDTLVIQDITMACDILHPVYQATNHLDGWVSVEVPPGLAYDAESTVEEVRRLRRRVGRPNVLVKIPATTEGVKAIRTSIGEGMSVNVTLIFSLQRYEEVMEAYLSGLEELVARRAAGADLPGPGQVHSVASFFVSRVDTKVDQVLEGLIRETQDESRRSVLGRLVGKAAVANAKLAYQRFKATFQGARWSALEAQGAWLQRPLWASTSTKNPAYRDVKYVEELIGRHTVNTMPQQTLEAFADHGGVQLTLENGLEEAEQVFVDLAELGVNMDRVTAQLETEGVQAFSASFNGLKATVDAKRRELDQALA